MRIVLVVDDDNKFIGTITDGDIRRALINKADMETRLDHVMCSEPVIASINDNDRVILNMMKEKDLTAIPIVDADGMVVDLQTIKTLIEDIQIDNTVFLLAGGFGKRLGKLTSDTPKPLLNIGDKPIIETIIQQLIKHNFHRFIISSHFMSEKLVNYFGNGEQFGVKIEHIYEKEPLGTAGSLGLIEKLSNDKPLLIMNADLLTAVNFRSLLRFHERSKVKATICAQEYVHQIPFGKLVVENQRLKSIVEKPKDKSFINAGIYVIEQEIIQRIPKNKYMDMPNLLSSILEDDEEIAVFPIHEYWLDVGQIEDFERGNKDYETQFGNG